MGAAPTSEGVGAVALVSGRVDGDGDSFWGRYATSGGVLSGALTLAFTLTFLWVVTQYSTLGSIYCL